MHALVESSVRSALFIGDSRASSNIVSAKESFPSFNNSKDPNILLGDKLKTESKGKGSIDFDHGSFNNVLYVPCLVANLL